MSLSNKIKHAISFLLHGEKPPIIANISYLQAKESLKGKKIIITGGGRGIGYSMAKKFIDEGAEVLIAGRNKETLATSAHKLGCQYLQLDVRNVGKFKDFIEDADKLLNGINGLVNNAGISLHEEGFLTVNPNQYDDQINTNLRGPFFLTQCFIEHCKYNKISGTKNILFVSSETGSTVDERPYGITKAAINSLVQGLAYRYVSENFRINAVAPGVTISDMVGKIDDGTLGYGAHRYFLPEEVAEVACFLMSDASNCLTGQILVCNEGKTINARWK